MITITADKPVNIVSVRFIDNMTASVIKKHKEDIKKMEADLGICSLLSQSEGGISHSQIGRQMQPGADVVDEADYINACHDVFLEAVKKLENESDTSSVI